MTITALLLIPILGACLSWVAERWRPAACRAIALVALVSDLLLALVAFSASRDALPRMPARAAVDGGAPYGWMLELDRSWFPRLGIRLHLALDGLSGAFVLLTLFLGVAAVVASWTEIRERVGFFHFNLLTTLAGILGVFTAIDLIVFYCFWEMMIVPMYFLIAIWGHGNRTPAAIKFFIFTQASGLFMLFAIVTLGIEHRAATGAFSFDYQDLAALPLRMSTATWLLFGFGVAFAVKLPIVPFHAWLPDAHTEAPTGASILLAGILLKTGGYGFIRFALPLFPNAVAVVQPAAMLLGVTGIWYGALLAFGQTDLKRIVAYSSINHMGFVVLGVFASTTLALQGAVLQMIAHGLGTGALFILAGAIQERIHSRDLGIMGGFWSRAPRLGAAALFFTLAAIGLPGLGSFVGEVLVLVGAFEKMPGVASLAAFGIVLALLYALRFFQGVFLGREREGVPIADLTRREMMMLAAIAILLAGLGLFPGPVLRSAETALERIALSRGQ